MTTRTIFDMQTRTRREVRMTPAEEAAFEAARSYEEPVSTAHMRDQAIEALLEKEGQNPAAPQAVKDYVAAKTP